MWDISNMPAKCPKGKIRRSAYTRKDGTYVKSTCVPDKGLPGKTPKRRRVLPKPVAGNLGKFGYSDVKNTPAAERHAALRRAVKSAGYATIIRRINLVANYSKNSDPTAYKIFRRDMKWIEQNLSQYSKTASRRASRKVSRKPSKKVSRKRSLKTSRKAMRKASRKAARKASRKPSKKASRKPSKKVSKKLVKAGTKTIAGRSRQLYHVPGSSKKFYQYRKKAGGTGRRYL